MEKQTVKMSSHDMHLSDQAVGCVMMALTKGVAEQCDITQVLKQLKMRMTEEGLFVLNPPMLKVNFDDDETAGLPGFVSNDD
jgi:hypothetical protein